MKAKSSAKVSSTSTARKAKSAPKAEATLNLSIPSVETRILASTEMDAKALLAAARERITPEVRSKLEALLSSELTVAHDVGMPIYVFASEALSAATRVEWHQLPRDGMAVSLSPHQARIGGDVAPELVYLVDQLRVADSMVAQGRAAITDTLIERARYILVRVRSAIEVVVDDGVHDGKSTLVRALRKAHESAPASIPALASAVAAYVDAARVFTAELSTLDGFDLAMLDEGAEAADTLSARKTATKNNGVRGAILRRGRLLQLIRVRLAKIRKIVRFAFASHPEAVREFFSAYNREVRRANRKAGAPDDVDDLDDDSSDGTEGDSAPTPAPKDDPV